MRDVSSAPLAGDTFAAPTLEPTTTNDDVPSDESEATATAAPPAGVMGQAAPKDDDGLEKKSLVHARRGGTPRAPRPAGSAQENAPGSAGASSNALFGAVGDRTAVDLAAAFTRAFPQASSPDPQWLSAPLGSAGETTVTLTLDDSGHIDSVIANAPPGALASGIARTMALLRARVFTARGKITRLHVSARIAPDQVHDGLHGDVFAIGQSFYGNDGNAFFALSVGRRIDIRIVLR